jgi:hypothetical protein
MLIVALRYLVSFVIVAGFLAGRRDIVGLMRTRRPTSTAATRRQPIRSPSSGPAISATTRGDAKVIEVTCARSSPRSSTGSTSW